MIDVPTDKTVLSASHGRPLSMSWCRPEHGATTTRQVPTNVEATLNVTGRLHPLPGISLQSEGRGHGDASTSSSGLAVPT